MINRLFNKLNKQKGFTLIELIVAGAIGVLVIGALVGVVWQLFSGSSSSSGNMKAIHQVQNVGLWVSKDVQQTNNKPSTADNPNTDDEELLVVEWTEYQSHFIDNIFIVEKKQHRILYRITDEKLYRDYYVTDGWMNIETEEADYVFPISPNSTTFIAEYIIDFIPYIPTGTNDVKLTVTAEIPGFRPQSATRVFEIEARPTKAYWVP